MSDLDDEAPELDARIGRLEKELAALRRRRWLRGVSGDALEIVVAGEPHLLPIGSIRELVPIVWPTPLPEAPAWVMGTFRYGEQIATMLDLGHRLSGRPTPLRADLAMVVLDRPDWVGVIVERVGELVPIDTAKVVPTAPGVAQAPFLLGTLAERGTRILFPEILAREVEPDV